MAIVRVNAILEGNIDKFESFKALCENLGLYMLTDGTSNEYVVENNILYHIYDDGYHGSGNLIKEEYSTDFQKVMLFENLVAIKSLL